MKALALAERKIVAEDLEVSVSALDGRIHTIRKRVQEMRWFINEIEKLEKRHPHIKRMMLPTKAETDEM